jgi:hypothetical protein
VISFNSVRSDKETVFTHRAGSTAAAVSRLVALDQPLDVRLITLVK